jgi:hypothetical protein
MKKKNLEDYLEDKLLEFCTLCVEDSMGERKSKLGRARKCAKGISNYIKKRWNITE